jgi:hypothetical protein
MALYKKDMLRRMEASKREVRASTSEDPARVLKTNKIS